MDADRAGIARLNRLIWMSIAAVAAIVLVACVVGPFEPAWNSFAKATLASTALAAGGWYYQTRRDEPGLALALTGTAQMIAFALVAAPLSYVAASAGFPLRDATFLAWDRSLGFDWMAALRAMGVHPQLETVLGLAYASFPAQMIATILALGFTARIARLHTFIGAFIACALTTIAISAILPASGPWLFLQLDSTAANGFLPVSSTSWPVFLGLRDGSLHMLHGFGSEGIITFPSLHAALAILCTLALWQVAVLRWITLGLNIAMLAATPLHGSHYLVDVLAGIAIAAACWLLAARAVARTAVATPAKIPHFTIADAPALVPDSAPGRDIATTSAADAPHRPIETA